MCILPSGVMAEELRPAGWEGLLPVAAAPPPSAAAAPPGGVSPLTQCALPGSGAGGPPAGVTGPVVREGH